MKYLTNAKGTVVPMEDKRAAFLLDEKPTRTLVGGKKERIKKDEHEKGWKESTDAEIKAYKAKFESKKPGGPKPVDTGKTAVDVLKTVEGIGPKIAENLVNVGIESIEQLKEEFQSEKVQGVLNPSQIPALRTALGIEEPTE